MTPEELEAIYNAYANGEMTPEEAAEYEADVKAGLIQMPEGSMPVDATQAPDEMPEDMPLPASGIETIPDDVVSAYFSGQMSQPDMIQLAEDIQAGLIEKPEGIEVKKGYLYPGKKDYYLEKTDGYGVGETVAGVAETAATLGTGAVTGTIGHIIGTLQGLGEALVTGKLGTQEGARLVQDAAQQLSTALTYEPKTEVGQEMVETVGETLQPLEAIAPLGAEIATVGRGVMQRAKPLVTRIGKQLTEEVDLAKAAIPETQKAKILKDTIKYNPTSKEAAKYKLVNGRVVTDKIANDAIKQGFEEGVISSIKSGTDLDRKSMKKMLNIHKIGRKSADFAAKNRPTDVIGESINNRVKFLRKTKSDAVKEIEAQANKLRGKKVDFDPAVNQFLNDLDDMGVKVIRDEKGKININLRGSDIEGDMASQKLLKNIFTRLVETDVPDGYGVHKAKRFIDTQVSYGTRKADPLSGATEAVVKRLRKGLNDALGNYSGQYKSANTKFADMVTALDDIQKAVGSKVDFDSPGAQKAFGTVSRRVLSNASSRTAIMDAFDNLDNMAKKYGMDVNDDIIKQVIFANELDRMFGSQSPTSFKGQIEQAMNFVTGDRATQALNVAKEGIKKMKKINEENAIKSMEDLLRQTQ